jgi:hypothetical protein
MKEVVIVICSWLPDRRSPRPATRSTPSIRCKRRGIANAHSISGAKTDAADAHTLADIVHTEAHQPRPVAADSRRPERSKWLLERIRP